MYAHAASAVLFLSVIVTHNAVSIDANVVTLQKGTVRGYTIQRDTLKIFAFEGIPYARPPIGPKRFKDPEEMEPWKSELNATGFGPICMQISLTDQSIMGEEDCLFLNVYTTNPPETWGRANLPVLVWIHGGAFQFGSGNMNNYRPDLLLQRNIVFVSINYRLGVMGFLNAGNSTAPGNAGLKDMVMALKWVKNNILAFGGDAKNVTIFGESAGSAAVHHLTMSPLAAGLFQRAIAFSGTAITSNMIMEEPNLTAEHLRKTCDKNLDLVSCLQKVDAKVLVSKSMGPSDPKKVILDFCRNAFLPSIETPGSSTMPFLSQSPITLMNSGPVKPVPLFIGTTDAEGIIFFRMGGAFLENPSRWKTLDENFMEAFLPDLPFGLGSEENVHLMRKHYIGDHKLSEALTNNDTLYGFIRMTTDVYFGVGTVRAAEAAAKRGAPVYLFLFSYDYPAMATNKRNAYRAMHLTGVAHSDGLPYVFSLDFKPTAAAAQVRNRMVDMVANFVKTGNPTPKNSSLPVTWPPYDPQKEKYVEINQEIAIKDVPLQGRMAFWRELKSGTSKITISNLVFLIIIFCNVQLVRVLQL